jgi:hypothetical protein
MLLTDSFLNGEFMSLAFSWYFMMFLSGPYHDKIRNKKKELEYSVLILVSSYIVHWNMNAAGSY